MGAPPAASLRTLRFTRQPGWMSPEGKRKRSILAIRELSVQPGVDRGSLPPSTWVVCAGPDSKVPHGGAWGWYTPLYPEHNPEAVGVFTVASHGGQTLPPRAERSGNICAAPTALTRSHRL